MKLINSQRSKFSIEEQVLIYSQRIKCSAENGANSFPE
jgi:hypothetical protein